MAAAGPRARDLGIRIGEGRPGPANAITDVAGVRVGHVTLIAGDGPRAVGRGPVRTGVTIIVPHDGPLWSEPLFAGPAVMNGNGEMTGLEWIRESGLLVGPIGLTNTNAVGTVRDALAALSEAAHPSGGTWALPVAAETWDGRLNDIAGGHVRAAHVTDALGSAAGGPVAEGNVGGGTGMICHEFKGGIGTASRRLPDEAGGWTVGVLVQANHGRRGLLQIAGAAVGREIPFEEVPSPWEDDPAARPAGAGSIVGIVATDAPLLPHQCARLARRAPLGVARTGGLGATTSGDLFLCFATGNRGLPAPEDEAAPPVVTVRALADLALDPLFEATVEATEEAIVNALVAAETMTGADGVTAHRLPHGRLLEILDRHDSLREPT
jgi:D-aminopeptidase